MTFRDFYQVIQVTKSAFQRTALLFRPYIGCTSGKDITAVVMSSSFHKLIMIALVHACYQCALRARKRWPSDGMTAHSSAYKGLLEDLRSNQDAAALNCGGRTCGRGGQSIDIINDDHDEL